MQYRGQNCKRRVTMKKTIERREHQVAGKLTYFGGGAGLALFAVFGLTQAAFIGGVLGINIAGSLMGYPLVPALITRAIVAIGMLTGITSAGMMFVVAGTTLGWLAGTTVDYVTGHDKDLEPQKIKY
jgi:hypothetical protein